MANFLSYYIDYLCSLSLFVFAYLTIQHIFRPNCQGYEQSVVCVCFLTCNIYFSPIPLFKIFGLHIYPPAYLYKLRNFQVNKHILIILYIFLYIIVLDLPAAISNCQIWHMFFKTNHSFKCCSVYVCFEIVWKLEWKH